MRVLCETAKQLTVVERCETKKVIALRHGQSGGSWEPRLKQNLREGMGLQLKSQLGGRVKWKAILKLDARTHYRSGQGISNKKTPGSPRIGAKYPVARA